MRNYIPWEKAESIAPDRVKVYRNLTYKCWTICDAQDGKLYCHADSVDLRDCKFRVQPAGRERVLREKRKNVHAGIKGYIDDTNCPLRVGTEVTYNPYKYDSFVDKNTEEPVFYSGFAKLSHKQVLVA